MNIQYGRFPKNVLHANHGQSLVELLVAIGLMSIMLPAVMAGVMVSREGKAQQGQRLQATTLLQEAQEAIRSIREAGFSQVATNGTYHPVKTATAWSLGAGSETVSGYTRQIVISDVLRDTAGQIVTSGGTIDPATKQVTAMVSWQTPRVSSVSAVSYLSRHANNLSWIQTTQAEFDTGTKTSVVSTANGGGTVELATMGSGSWATPQVVAEYNSASTGDGQDVFVSGNYAFLVTDGTSTAADFTILDITNPETPITLGELDLASNGKGVFVVGDYAYVATTHDTRELTVISVANKSAPTIVGSRDLSGTTDATSVFVANNYAYVGRLAAAGAVRELAIINVTTPTAPGVPTEYEAGVNINSVFVSGNFAYLASASDTQELTILNVTTPTSPSLAGSYNAVGTLDATDVYAINTTVYLTTLNNSTGTNPEFYILNAAAPGAVTQVGNYNVTNTANGVFVLGTYAFLATNVNSKHLMVLDITTPATPTEFGSVSLGGNGTDLYVAGDYAYITDVSNSRELAIVKGGIVGYALSGTFESATFDAGSEVGFHSLQWIWTRSDIPPLGNTTDGTATDSSNSNIINATRFVMGSTTRTVTSMTVRVAAADSAPDNQYEMAIYADNAGSPGTLIAKSQRGTLTANTWNTMTITATLNASTNYWLAYNTNGTRNSANNMRYTSGGTSRFTNNAVPFGTWPQTFGASTTQAISFTIYATFDTAITPAAQVKMQIATSPIVTGPWNYIGQDGTATTYFTVNGPFPLAVSTGRYIRYKAFLTGDGTITPALEQVVVNYSQ